MASGNINLLIGASAFALMALPGAAGAQETQEAEDAAEAIVVTGFRQSLESAQAVKQESDQIVDSVLAEDIGKLPDQTVAETAARITGVSVERSNGEASAVRVRGLPDLTTTYNGREVFTAQGRYVQLQDFPSGTIGRIDVYKTSAANLPEAGIAGEIDLKAQKPFNFRGMRIAGGVAGVHWRQSQQLGFDANLLLSNRWETGIGEIGLLVGGSYAQNKAGDSLRQTSLAIQERGATGDFARARYPADINFDTVASDRVRSSVSTVLQWRPNPDLEFYGDFLYQGFHSEGGARAVRVQAGSGATISDVTYCPGSTLLICQMTATGGNPVTSYASAQGSDTDTYHGGGGFIWKTGGARITGDVGYTDSTFTTANFQLNSRLNAVPTRTFNFAEPGGGGSAQILGVNLADPANWRIVNYNEGGSQAAGRGWQGRLDADIPIEVSIFDRLQVGVRYTDRDARAASYNVPQSRGTFPTAGGGLADLQFTALPLDFYNVSPAFKGDPTDHPRTWIAPERDSIYDYRDFLRTLAGEPAGTPERVPQYWANERTYAAYAQTHYEFEIGTVRIDGQIGVRAVRTENEITTAENPTTGKSSYEDYLPNISTRIRLTPNLQARFAFTKTSSRPGFSQFNPVVTVAGGCAAAPTCASSGNPDLQPIKSTNYDASLEYYFSRSGSATVQIFRRDVKGFINNTTTIVTDPDIAPGEIALTRPENGQKGYIQGVEVGFRSFLKIASLPEWMQNFGVLANYTYLDHKTELAQSSAATLPGLQPIANTSSHLANAQIFYETKKLSLRASYNYRSKFYEYGITNDPEVTRLGGTQLTLPTTEKGRGILDLSASINPTDFMSINFSASNVLGTPVRTSRVFNARGESYDFQVGYRETVYRMGVRFRI